MMHPDALGRIVRDAWIRWARKQPHPKASWLVPYDKLSEADKEADRQIGMAVEEAVVRKIQVGLAVHALLKDKKAMRKLTRETTKAMKKWPKEIDEEKAFDCIHNPNFFCSMGYGDCRATCKKKPSYCERSIPKRGR